MTIQEEVGEFLVQHKDRFIHLLQDVEHEVKMLRRDGRLGRIISDQYSRSKKQGTGELKEHYKIAQKLQRWREEDPRATPLDVHDVIGMTIVVLWPKHVDLVVDALRNHLRRHKAIRFTKAEKKSERGYYAKHVVVQGVEGGYRNLLCEIQVKTELHDGWGTKTHDLIFKPQQRRIAPGLNKQMELLGELVQLVEKQGEIISDEAEKHLVMQRVQRDVATRQLLAASRSAIPRQSDFPSLIEKMVEQEDELRRCDEGDDVLRGMLEQWETLWAIAIAKAAGYQEGCRAIAYLAVLREGGELDDRAVEAADKWLELARGRKNKTSEANALVFKANILCSGGHYPQALKAAEQAQSLPRNEVKTWTMVLASVAYYLAERYFHRSAGSELENPLKKALILIDEAIAAALGNKAAHQDTKGAILISCGTTKDEVREGYLLCSNSLPDKADPLYSASHAYFELHELRACERLLEFEEPTSRLGQ